MDIKAIRHGNLTKLLEGFDHDVEFAEACELAPGHLSQLKNRSRAMGDDVARRIERQRSLPSGWMDVSHAADDRKTYDVTPAALPRVPVVGTAQLGPDRLWLELEYPVGHGDGFVTYPSRDPNCYAVRCKGDSMRPRIKPGEFVVAEPNRAYGPGDEVVAKDRQGRVMVKVFNFRRNGSVELGSINEDHKPITLELADIEYIHYVAAILKPSMYYEDFA